jgi:hypothetical protein
MPDSVITSTESTFGTIAGTFAADQSTIAGTVTALTGTIDGSVGVPGPQGEPGEGVPAGGLTAQYLIKDSGASYDTAWATLTPYLPLAGGVITGDIQSNNGSGYRSYDNLYSQVNVSAALIQLLNAGPGGNTLSIEWDGITFADGKQTVKYPGPGILSGYALESWVTANFAPLPVQPTVQNSGSTYNNGQFTQVH